MISHRHPRSSSAHSSSSPTTNNNKSKPSICRTRLNSNTSSSSSSRSASASTSSLLPSTILPTSAINISNRSSTKATNMTFSYSKHYWLLAMLTVMVLSNRQLVSNSATNEFFSSTTNDQLSLVSEAESIAASASKEFNTYHNSAAICVIQKGALRYIDEWVYYNLLGIGFDHIYFYDNSDDFELQEWHKNIKNLTSASTTTSTTTATTTTTTTTTTTMDPIIIQQQRQEQQQQQQQQQTVHERISIQHFPGPNRQNEAYTNCVKHIQNTKAHSWIAFIDVDEFLVIRNQTYSNNIMNLLNTLPKERYAGLAVNWIIIGMNQQQQYQPLPVTKRFSKRAANATDTHIKTIARTDRIDFVDHPHFVHYEKKGQYLNRHYNYNYHHQQQQQQQQHSTTARYWKRFGMLIWELVFGPMIESRDLSNNRVRGPWNKHKTVEEIALYHYHTKSLEEYKERCSRGRADVPLKAWNEQLSCQPEEVIKAEYWNWQETIVDDLPWQLLKERVPSYANQFVDVVDGDGGNDGGDMS
ncbi:unnamed protein product [Cylindrotheca closterium]|uniref:Glycosyltransferase family 92 protein n=1 Tax=Cylindrotheca closterium TaxID=2856 RepID=A0AAD2FX89_9STRA|nr:unnamed protein product [Cylindrotheca closterium]